MPSPICHRPVRRRLLPAIVALAALAAAAAQPASAAEEWLSPETLATGPEADTLHTTFAYGSGGDAVMAAERSSGGHLVVRYRPAGGSWSPEEDLGASTASGTDRPLVAVGPEGTVAIVNRHDGSAWRYVSVRDPDGTWDIRGIPYDSSVSSVAVGPHGEVAVAYTPHWDYYDRPFSVYERRADGTWTRTPLDTQVIGQRPSGIGFDADGDVVAAWVRPATASRPEEQVVAAERPADGEWPDPATTPPTEVATARPLGGAEVRISLFNVDVAPSGAAVVAWADHLRSDSVTDVTVQAARRTGPGEPWTGREAVAPGQRSLASDFGVSNAVVRAGVADDGTATVAWLYEDGDAAHVSVADRAPGDAAWTTERVAAETYTGIDDRYKQMDLDVNGRGDAVVGWWLRHDGDPIQSAVRAADADGWTADVRERTTYGSWPEVDAIDVGVDDQGNALMGWTLHQGATARATGYDAAGPRLTALQAPGGTVGDELRFSVAATDAWGAVDPSAVRWSFGDGGEATGLTPAHTYAAAGRYTVSVQAADERGLTTTRSASVDVLAPENTAPTAAFTVSPATATAGDEVRFDAGASEDPDGAIASYEWDFDGDGSPDRADGANVVTVAYGRPGTYAVRLRVQDDRGAWSAPVTREVTIVAPPAPAAAPAPSPGPAPGDPPVTQQPEPDPFAGLSVTAPAFRVVAASHEREVPDVVGRHVDRARAVLDRVHYVRYTIDWVHHHPRHHPTAVGEVLRQSPAAGRVRDSAVGAFLPVELTVYAGPRSAKTCPAGFKQALRGEDFDLGHDLIEAARCVRLDDVDFHLSGKGSAPEIRAADYGRLRRGGREIDLKVSVPRDVADQDLFLVFSEYRPGYQLHTFGTDWALSAGFTDCLRVQVFDRDHALVENAEVRFDVSDVKGPDPSMQRTDENGEVRYCAPHRPSLKPARAGTMDVVAFATGTNGETVFGTSRIRVVRRTGDFTTPGGRTVKVAKRAGRARAAGPAQAAGLDLGAWWSSVTATISGAWQTVATPIQALGQGIKGVVGGIRSALASGGWEHAGTQLGAYPGNMNPGRALSAGAGVIASGAGNVIASGAGNVIASGGGNVIASGGGNVIASGALNLIERTGGQVIASGGGNVIASGGGNVIAYGGGNVIAAGGGNVIASGGGNVISYGGGNVIASGGGNLVSRAARPGGAPVARAAADAPGEGFRAVGSGTVLRLPGRLGATMVVATGMLLPTEGDAIVGVKDAAKSEVLNLGDGIWVLRQPGAGQ